MSDLIDAMNRAIKSWDKPYRHHRPMAVMTVKSCAVFFRISEDEVRARFRLPAGVKPFMLDL